MNSRLVLESIKMQMKRRKSYHQARDCNTGATHDCRVFLHVNLRSIDATDKIGIRRVHCVWSSVAVESLQRKIDRFAMRNNSA